MVVSVGISFIVGAFMRAFHSFPFGLTILFIGLFLASPVWSQGSLLESEPDVEPTDAESKAEAFMEQGDALYGSDPLKAAALYTKAIELNPNKIEYYLLRANAFREAGEYKNALDDTYTMNKLWPTHDWGYYLRAKIFMDDLERYEDAIKDFSKAIELEASPNALTWRAHCKRMVGDYKGAIADANEVLKDENAQKLDEIAFLRVYTELVQIYAACPDSRYHDKELALQYAKRACELFSSDCSIQGNCLPLLGMAYAENGEFEKAIEANRKARKYYDEKTDHEFIKKLDQWEELYKQNKPFRLPPPPKKDEKKENP